MSPYSFPYSSLGKDVAITDVEDAVLFIIHSLSSTMLTSPQTLPSQTLFHPTDVLIFFLSSNTPCFSKSAVSSHHCIPNTITRISLVPLTTEINQLIAREDMPHHMDNSLRMEIGQSPSYVTCVYCSPAHASRNLLLLFCPREK